MTAEAVFQALPDLGYNRVLSKNSADRRFESTNDAQIDLRSGAMVEAQHPAESLGAFDEA